MNNRASFIMPVKISGNERELRHLWASVESIRKQTDENWNLIIVDDFSDDDKVYAALDAIREDLKDKIHVIRLEKNVGAGMARNAGIRYAEELGAPFILFNDADDLSDHRRLEMVRKAFQEDDTANVVYMSFDVIDENDRIVPQEDICFSVREIIQGHQRDVLEGENAWIGIATKKNYTNLTSCTAVRTWLAAKEPFPKAPVSEDSHAWLRYGAYPGRFVFLREIKNHYRICSDVQSRSRGSNLDFYEQKASVEQDGFEKALALARGFGCIRPEEENGIRTAFYVRLALSMLYGESEQSAKKLLQSAAAISDTETLADIDRLDCDPDYKIRLKEMVS